MTTPTRTKDRRYAGDLLRVAAATIAMATSASVSAADWQWSITPYLWATDVGIDVAVADRELVDATIPFDDLLDDLETVTQIRAEAMHGTHGLAFDLFNVGLAEDGDRVPLPDATGGALRLDTQTGMTILDLTGLYNPPGDGSGLSLLYGVRLINQRNEIDATIELDGLSGPTASYDSDATFIDGLLGLRYVGRLPGRWSYQLAADVSTGGTDLTWSIEPAVGFTFGARDQYRLTAGYRHMVVDFDTADVIDMDMTLTGILVGFRFTF